MADAMPLHALPPAPHAGRPPARPDAAGGHPPEHIEVYVQAQGCPAMVLIQVARDGSTEDLVIAAANAGLAVAASGEGAVLVSAEDADEPLRLDVRLEVAGIRHRGRVHLHCARRVAVTVHFNGRHVARDFPPAVTIERVFEWATGKKGFDLDPLDAAEHALQLPGTNARPADDVHLGTLLSAPACAVAFDLVPKRRVEG